MHPTLIHIGHFYIATYGVLVAAGYLICILWLQSQVKSMKLTEERFWILIYCLFFGALAGGKILFMLLNWQSYASGQMGLIRDFRYGFVFFGGFLGVVAMGLVYFRGSLSEFMRVSDYFAAIVPVGHAIGRFGCLAAGCCYGRPTTVPWAIRFNNPRSLVAVSLLGVPLHPTQLYEAAGNLIIAGALMQLLKKVQRGEFRPGSVFAAYVLSYSALRFVVEFYRGDDRGGFWYGLSPSQWIAMAAAAGTAVVIWRGGLWPKKSA